MASVEFPGVLAQAQDNLVTAVANTCKQQMPKRAIADI
jgi:hypothetical protein